MRKLCFFEYETKTRIYKVFVSSNTYQKNLRNLSYSWRKK